MTTLLLFSGSIGSGKNYISNQKIQKLNECGNTVFQLSFADEIKKFVDACNGFNKNLEKVTRNSWNHVYDLGNYLTEIICNPWDLRKVYHNDAFEVFAKDHQKLKSLKQDSDTLFKRLDEPEAERLVRHMYQILGTEIMHNVHPSIWALITAKKIIKWKLEEFVDYIVIDDFRYLSELFTLQALLPNLTIDPYAVTASKETRSIRRNVTIEELTELSNHKSEYEFETMILPYIERNYPNNVIENDDR